MNLPSDFATRINLFKGLTPAEISWVCQRLHERQFPPAVDLVTEGEPSDLVYFILDGTVKVYLPQLDGGQVILNIQGPGDVVGELGAIDQAGHSASVITLETTFTLWMTRTHFLEMLRTIPRANENLLCSLVGRVRRVTRLIRTFAALDVPGRIAHQLLLLAEEYGQNTPHGVLIRLRLPQSEIAELVGASRRRANQVMVAFKRQGVLSADPEGHITLHCPDALRALVD
uniref:Crp/Fnr family transcriptional regulator n=1 Tax=Anaerolinea thermolimosa TaxID=229919 RepID=A0A7C4PJD2_9CHLR